MEYFLLSDIVVLALLLIVFMKPIAALCREIYDVLSRLPQILVPDPNKNKKGDK